jgi:hypothetical protein
MNGRHMDAEFRWRYQDGPSSMRMHVTKPKDRRQDKTINFVLRFQRAYQRFFLASCCSFIVSVYFPLQYRIPQPQTNTSISVTCLDNNTKPTIKKKNLHLPPTHVLQTQYPLPYSQRQHRINHHVFHHPKYTRHYNTHRSPIRTAGLVGTHRRIVFSTGRRDPRSRRR